MGYYPLFLELSDTPCLVVGGGAVACRKIKGLLSAGACVTVVSASFSAKIDELHDNKSLRLIKRGFKAGDLRGASLVIAASSDRGVNEEVRKAARAGNVPVNVVDDPVGSAFIVPSVTRRGGLTIAVSTAGRCPALSRRTRLEIEKTIGPEYGPFLEIMAAVREKLLKSGVKGDKKDRIINELLDSALLGFVRAEVVEGVEKVLHDTAAETLTGLGLDRNRIFSSQRGDGC